MASLQADILPFQAHHQADIDLLMTMISKEFSEIIFSPQSKTMTEVSLLPTDKYWVALTDGKVIGTIGFTNLKNNSIALKRMFLNQEFRGQGIAKMLLDTVIKWAADNGVENIYLGTMLKHFIKETVLEKLCRLICPLIFQ